MTVMTDDNREFQMSSKEVEYLKQLALRDESFVTMLRFQEGPHGRVILQLSRAEAAKLRDYLGTQLAMFGFDENYSPTEQGTMLERLIDKFFIR
jgi:hypothetical protein